MGDIITTEKDVHLPLVVSIEGRPKFHAEPGVFKGRKAVQVKESISERPSGGDSCRADASAGNGARRSNRGSQAIAGFSPPGGRRRRTGDRPNRFDEHHGRERDQQHARPRHRIGGRENWPAALKNRGSVISASAHVLIMYITTVGMPVTNQTHHRCVASATARP